MTALPPIVGIGASAGGLEALQDFVHAIPNDSGIAYVVVQHLAPDQPSLMDKLLRAHTPVPVNKIEDGAIIAPDNIYIIPPGPFLEIDGGRFRLIEHEREEGVRTPIDRFFTSLAAAGGRTAFAVVLSGTGSDGTGGVRAVKTNGGIAIVQESRSARFPGMPNSAAATGLVDFVLRPKDMPGKILEIVNHRRYLDEEVGRQQLLDEVEDRLAEVLDRIEDEAGNSFTGYKPGTLVRRVARRMTLLRQRSIDGYLRTLKERPEERQLLMQDFLIGVTQFFRDPESFEALRKNVLKPLLDRDQASFRVWVPGCSTGEEAYSIAILISEMLDETGDKRTWKIFGTDIDIDALRVARTGHYSEASLQGLSEERREGYFTPDEGYWHVAPRLREMCVFAPHNLIQDPPFSKLDLISCRNVMIYLNAESQAALLPRFHYALNASGFLWLGPSETVGHNGRYFRAVDRTAKIFRRDDKAAPGFSAISRTPLRRSEMRDRGLGAAAMRPRQGRQERENGIESQSEQLFLQQFAAPFLTVDRSNEVIYVSEAMTSFIRPSRGVPSTSLDDFLTPELRLPVHTGLDEARESGLEAEVQNVVVPVGGSQRLFDIKVVPFGGDNDAMLVGLIEVRQRGIQEAGLADRANRQAGYEQELLLTRKRLSAVEREYETAEQELRSANEELLSMNEELQSSNEELETSREELQSINEELETINSELSENNRQLTRANSDLKNLLESTDIATLFIDENDCVRLFTPELGRLFGVQERDVGRSIHDLASRIDYPDLRTDAEKVRRTLQPIEREVRVISTDETFAMRLSPYRTVDNRLDGVVITFVDVTVRKRHERQLEENARVLGEQYAELETLYDTAPVGLNLLDRDLRYLRINKTLAAINGIPVEDHIGRLQEELLPEAHAQTVEIQRRVLETGEPALGLAVATETPAEPGRVREFIIDYYPVRSDHQIFAIGSCVREVTNERELERRMAESAVRQRIAVDAAGLGVFEWRLRDDHAIWENDRMYEIFGVAPERGPLSFEDFSRDVIHPDDLAPFTAAIEEARTTGTLNAVVRIRRMDDARWRFVEYFATVKGGTGDADQRMLGVLADITEARQSQEREREQHRMLQRLQDSLSAFVGMLDPDGTLTEANATALKRGGLEPRDVIGRKFWDCWWWSYSEESQERLKAAVARAAQGETVRYDTPARMAGGQMITIDFQLVPIVDDDGVVREIVPSAIDVTERVRAEERKDILVAELEHRVKNILATIQSIARFTARMSTSKEDMARSLMDRLAAISRTHDALTAADWEGQSLRSLVEAEVAPYADLDNERFSFRGDDLHLEPRTALSLGLALHELATNAAKYGAFSGDEGRVEFTVEKDGPGFARLEWRERDGPSVKPPERAGFGTFLIQSLLEQELDADVTLEYEVDGLRCVIRRREVSHS